MTPDARTILPPHRTLADYAYQQLREQVIRGELAPGTRLDQRSLCEQFGISRTPLREVIRRLESEGLLNIASHRGVTVAKMGLEDARQLYAIRAELESLAVKLAMSHEPSTATATELSSIVRAMEKAVNDDDVAALPETHNQFHRALYLESQNPHLVHLIEELMTRCEWFRRRSLSIPGHAERTLRLHQEISAAYAIGDTARVQDLVRNNLALTLDALEEK